ncbi:MAG: hypothetical protein HS108_15625 [Planctomycetes bacterium]|jgi:hypothetical protein|nr:hypothetical protein [Planctomycetota bacterium]MCL4731755.1 hypothetical protein [Planctomycetota bacterium]
MISHDLNTPVQREFADAFLARKRAMNGRGGKLEVKRHPEPMGELEVWYLYCVGGTEWELIAWVCVDSSLIVEARSRRRKTFGKKLFSTRLKTLGAASKSEASLVQVRRDVEDVVAAFEESIGCLNAAGSEQRVSKALTKIWGFLAHRD